MKKVLFVCHGNICRSPMAQFIMQDIVNKNGQQEEYLIDSAATTTDEIAPSGIGNSMDNRAQRILDKHHIPFGNHFARLMKKEDYQKYDYLIGMDEENFYDMNRISSGDPKLKEKKLLFYADSMADVDDPWYTGDFETAYQDIKRGCEALYNKIENGEN